MIYVKVLIDKIIIKVIISFMVNQPEKGSESVIGRRKMLEIGGYTLGTLVLSGIGYVKRKNVHELLRGPTEACRVADLIADRASKMKNVGYVNVQRHARAKHALVVFRQYHRAVDMTLQERKMVEEVQLELSDILEALMDDPDVCLKEVLNEGDTEWLMQWAADMKSTLKQQDPLEALMPTLEELEEEAKILEKILMLELNEREKIHFQSELEELQRSIEEEKKNQQMKKDAHQKAEEEKKLSAAEMLAQKRGLRIEPAEEIGPSLHAHLAMKNPQYPDRANIIMRNREAVVLKLASKRGPFSIVLFGAKHDFREVVGEWNSTHPDGVFTLVEVTSKRIAEAEGSKNHD